MRRLARWLTVVRLVHLRELRRHPLRTAIAVVSVAAGVSMVLSIVVVVESTTRSFEQQAAALRGPAPLRVVGATQSGGVRPDDLDTIRGTDGVALVAPLVRGVLQYERRTVEGVELFGDVVLLGVDCSTATVLGVECAALDDGMVTSPAVAERADLALRTDRGPVPIDVATVSEELEAVGPHVAVVTVGRAQDWLSRPDGIDVAYVVGTPGTAIADLEERLDPRLAEGLLLLGAEDLPPEFDQVLSTIIPLFGLIGIVALAIGAILVANTVALALEERRQQLAVVAAIGGTPRQVVNGAVVQAAVVGLLGGLLGTGGAVLLAHPLTDSTSDFTLATSGARVEVVASAAPVAPGLLLGALVAVVASWRPARRARRTDVSAELSNRDRRAEADTGNLAARALSVVAIGVLGAGLAAVGGADGSLEPWQPVVGLLGLLLAVGAFSLAMGRITALVATEVLGRWSSRWASIRLATANLAREPSRTAVMGLAVGAAVATALIVAGFNAQAEAGIRDGTTATYDGALSVTVGSSDGDEQIFRGVSPAAYEAIRDHEGVDRAERGGFVFANGSDGGVAVYGTEVETPSGPRVYDGVVDAERFASGEVMIGAALARAQGIRAGDHVAIPVHDGVAELPVMGVWADGNAVGNSVTMSYERLVALYDHAPVDAVRVVPRPGMDVDELAAALRVASPDPALRVEGAADIASRATDQIGDQLAPFWALQRGLTAVAFIAVLSTLLLVGIQRTRELGLLAAVGMEPQAIGRMVLAEALITGIIATVVAAVVSVVMTMALAVVMPLILGWENPIRLAFDVLPVYAPITVGLALAGAAFPAWRAARVRVVEALAYE